MAETIISTLSPGLAAAYSSAATYAKGVFVLYQNAYWRCNTPISTPEEWNPDHWTAVPNVLEGTNEVQIGTAGDTTFIKLLVVEDETSESDSSDPAEVDFALVSDFNPTTPASYVQSFITGTAMTAAVKSIVEQNFVDGDNTAYPETSESSSDSSSAT